MTSGAFIDLNDSGRFEMDLWFDFACPWAYQASLWARDVFEMMGDDYIALRFRFFSLAQANRQDENWNIWEQKPDDPKAWGLLAFLAGAAIRKHGDQVLLDRFYKALAMLHHEQKEPLEQATIEKAATEAGVDMAILKPIFDGDIAEAAAILKTDHTEAVEQYGIFGSSTFVFEEKYPIYVRLMPRPPRDKVLEVFQYLTAVTIVQPSIIEIKRPISDEKARALVEEALAPKPNYEDEVF